MVPFHLDHVIVHVRDLQSAVADWRSLGLEATDGGRHPKMGTRNAIVRFPDRSFLELITIEDREKVREIAPAMLAFVTLHPDGPLNWALRVEDEAAAHEQLLASGFRVGQIMAGEGRRDTGRVARWHSFSMEEAAFPFVVRYEGPPTSEPARTGLPIGGIGAAIVQGVSAGPLAERLATAFGTLREDGRVHLAQGEIAVVEVPEQHPGVIGVELLVTDEAAARKLLTRSGIEVVDGWVRSNRLYGLAVRLVSER